MSRSPLLVVVAGTGDVAPEQLAAHWPGEVLRLTCADLSRPGWAWRARRPDASWAVMDGRRLRVSSIAAAVVRLGWVTEADLPWIAAEDRGFVAAEMQAFLLAFLATLPCPVWNPPSPSCLAGPVLRPLQWHRLALAHGFPVAPGAGTSFGVTVVGDRCMGAGSPSVAARARRLAGAAGARLLRLELSGPAAAPVFHAADPWADLGDAEVASALCTELAAAA